MRISDWSSDVCSSDLELDGAARDAAGEDAAEEVVAIEQRHQERERRIGIDIWRGHMLDDLLEPPRQRAVAHIVVGAGIAVAAAGEEHGEIELVAIALEAAAQTDHLVEHFLSPRARTHAQIDSAPVYPTVT